MIRLDLTDPDLTITQELVSDVRRAFGLERRESEDRRTRCRRATDRQMATPEEVARIGRQLRDEGSN